MYAIIKMGGNQYKVSIGQILDVDRVSDKEDSTIKIPAIMVVDGEKILLAKDAEKILVSAQVVRHLKGDKIDVMRFRHKVRHRRHIGFRASLTQLKIVSISDSKVSSAVLKEPKTVKKTKKSTSTSKK